jgi:hypothetical protein
MYKINMYTDSILNDYLESSQIDQSQLSDFLIMLEDYKTSYLDKNKSYLMMRAPLMFYLSNN